MNKKRLLMLMGNTPTYFQKIKSTSPIMLLPLWDDVGSASVLDISGNGLNGVPIDVQLGSSGIGDGKTSALLNGTSSVIDIYSAGLNAVFPKSEGSLMICGKIGADEWTDGTGRRFVSITQDSNNRLYVSKSSSNNIIECYYIANSVSKAINVNCNLTSWVNIIITWSLSNDRFRVYLNSSQSGVDQTSLGTWAAGNLLVAETVLGARTKTGANWFKGNLAYFALWNKELTQAEIDKCFF